MQQSTPYQQQSQGTVPCMCQRVHGAHPKPATAAAAQAAFGRSSTRSGEFLRPFRVCVCLKERDSDTIPCQQVICGKEGNTAVHVPATAPPQQKLSIVSSGSRGRLVVQNQTVTGDM